MPIPVEASYVLALMLKAQPEAGVPWRSTYESTAAAVAKAANASPLFAGEDGPAKSASLAVSVMWFESHYKPNAEGDFHNGRPTSFCAFQISETNFKYLSVTRDQIQSDIQVCVDSGFRMMKASFSICSGPEWKLEDKLNQYATGGGVCLRPKHDEGAHRVRKAMWLFRAVQNP